MVDYMVGFLNVEQDMYPRGKFHLVLMFNCFIYGRIIFANNLLEIFASIVLGAIGWSVLMFDCFSLSLV